MKAQISILASESGAKIRVSKTNPSQGSIALESIHVMPSMVVSEFTSDGKLRIAKGFNMGGRFVSSNKRVTRILGDIKTLKVWIDQYGEDIPGQLVILEFKESERDLYENLLNPKKKGEEQLKYNLKRAGKDGPVCTINGERILRFTEYDPQCVMQDRLVNHDNGEEIKAWRASQKTAKAESAPESAELSADLPAERPKRNRKKAEAEA